MAFSFTRRWQSWKQVVGQGPKLGPLETRPPLGARSPPPGKQAHGFSSCSSHLLPSTGSATLVPHCNLDSSRPFPNGLCGD